ncbi:MAG: hypothetical protein EBR30_21100 [Cytophagia bacterium]|nr:hypothetical protein [Cytophagia bacterium]
MSGNTKAHYKYFLVIVVNNSIVNNLKDIKRLLSDIVNSINDTFNKKNPDFTKSGLNQLIFYEKNAFNVTALKTV